MQTTKSWVAISVALLSASCGRTSPLDREAYLNGTPGQGGQEKSGAGGKGGLPTSFGGAPLISGSGGTFSTAGGAFSTGGMRTRAGAETGGNHSAGEPSSCGLSPSDCATAAEPGCTENVACTGSFSSHLELSAAQAVVTDVVTSPDGRVAATGYFRGTMTVGGDALPLSSDDDASDTDATEAFVILLNSEGTPQWSYAFKGAGAQRPTGIDFAPNGELVVQGNWHSPLWSTSAPRAFVFRLSTKGALRWSKLWGEDSTTLTAGRLAIDNDGVTWLSGSFEGATTFDDVTQTSSGLSGYLLQLNEAGDLENSDRVRPEDWLSCGVALLAVDDEDSVVLVASGTLKNGSRATLLRKFSTLGTPPVFEKVFQSPSLFVVTALTVDRKMRIALAATFGRKFQNEGETFETGSNVGDVWVGQYSPDGLLAWQKHVRGSSSPALATIARGVATDPFDNIIVLGDAPSLTLEGETVKPDPERAVVLTFLFKLRPDGSKVWLRHAEGLRANAVAADNEGSIWVAGSFGERAWFGASAIEGGLAQHGLIAKISP